MKFWVDLVSWDPTIRLIWSLKRCDAVAQLVEHPSKGPRLVQLYWRGFESLPLHMGVQINSSRAIWPITSLGIKWADVLKGKQDLKHLGTWWVDVQSFSRVAMWVTQQKSPSDGSTESRWRWKRIIVKHKKGKKEQKIKYNTLESLLNGQKYVASGACSIKLFRSA